MSLEFAGALVHAPGMTGRRDTAPEDEVRPFFASLEDLRERIEAARLDALILITAEHFANFFMDNMPAFCIGLADSFPGPVEDEGFLKIPRTEVPGAPALARALSEAIIDEIDLAYSEEMVLDHGAMVPLHFLTPAMDLPVIPIIVNCLKPPLPTMKRCHALGRAIRAATDARGERIGLLGTGGLSHWPAMPGSGRVNAEWDLRFIDDFVHNRRDALLAYRDDEMVAEAGPGAHEIRAWVAVSGATEGAGGELIYYKPLPCFAIGGAVATMEIR